ncbi:hypothetical protein CABS01_14950 [Colletotrichum abscissum]|uniref:uncharacterized protein n=1 Tax=Colletotrichum abscissum TaxID=1671311 RepID=UPI0027D70A04|nr:uncharacterized protein CABS01_14950 [Colletotrichum abscissum]KAK1477483.1 hypothetical protein CABS01_14950 [Colletotrichum abscissum]
MVAEGREIYGRVDRRENEDRHLSEDRWHPANTSVPARRDHRVVTHLLWLYAEKRSWALWFLPKTPSNLRRLPKIVRESGTPESSHHTGHTETGCDARRDIVRRAIYRRSMTGCRLNRETCSLRRSDSNEVRPLAEEMEALMRLVDDARFAMFPTTAKGSQKQPKVCREDARDEMFVTAARDTRESHSEGAGPPFAREETDQHRVAHNDHEAHGRAHRRLCDSDKKRTHVRRQHEELREKHPKLGQRRRIEIGEEVEEEKEKAGSRLGNAGRSQDRRDQEQRRHEGGGMVRRRRIPGDGSRKKLVFAAVPARNRSPTNPVKGSPGQVVGMSLGPSSPDAGNEDRRSERRPGSLLHEEEKISVWEARQETLATLEGRS